MNLNIESMPGTKKTGSWISKLASRAATFSLSLAAATLLTAPRAQAQTNLTAADTNFILAAAQGGMTEVKLGQLASKNGTRDDVKTFGQMMVKDHTAINDDLKTLAMQKGVTLPDILDAKHQGMVDKMAALTGTDFDDSYVGGMTKAHTKDLKAFKNESTATQDAGIKAFLAKSIPVVEEHLKLITAMGQTKKTPAQPAQP